MNTLRTILMGSMMVTAMYSPALAVDTSKVYNSGILVLVFFGVLALIVLVQLIPALVMLFGMVRGFMKNALSGQKDTVEVQNMKQQ